MDLVTVEILSVIFGLLFIVLLIAENIWCWLFGILSSILSVYLFYKIALYSEAILYLYYIVMGVYGWWVWNRPKNTSLPITEWAKRTHGFIIGIGLLGAISLGTFFNTQTDASTPYIDAHTTAFSFVATYLEVHKVLSAWLYWIVVNFVTIGLYFYKDLYMYGGLMIVYFILSIVGYFRWKALFHKTVTA